MDLCRAGTDRKATYIAQELSHSLQLTAGSSSIPEVEFLHAGIFNLNL